MNKFVETLIDDRTATVTENGDKTYKTSLNACVDLFFKAGTLRHTPSAVLPLFEAAYREDRVLALKLALWTRDIRGGAGERDVFQNIMFWLEVNAVEDAVRLIKLVPQFGYWKELFKMMNTSQTQFAVVKSFADAILAGDGLAAKWMPRKGPFTNRVRGLAQMTPKAFRRMLVHSTNVVETRMCAKDWNEINYSHVPSVAMKTYANAFKKHDGERFSSFLTKVEKGEVKINAGALFPYDCIRKGVDDRTASAQWSALPDFVPEEVNFLPMIDVSGSMDQQSGIDGLTAMDIAVSVGMYLMERNKSAFKDLALTFHSHPDWIQSSKSHSIQTRFNHIKRAPWGGSTNLLAGFQQILSHAVRHGLKQSDMPTHLLVLSDMEFNATRSGTFATAQQDFERAGYKLPTVVFWNIARAGAGKSVPVRYDTSGAILVSGSSPAVVKGLLGGVQSPIEAMLATINSDRYNVID